MTGFRSGDIIEQVIEAECKEVCLDSTTDLSGAYMQVATPSAPWMNSKSQNFRCLSALYTARGGESGTLYEHRYAGWMWQNRNGEDSHQLVNCKICLCLLTQPFPGATLGISHSVGE